MFENRAKAEEPVTVSVLMFENRAKAEEPVTVSVFAGVDHFQKM
jgi:hypothetical protein